jgi:ABC-type lipoprotein release transport system permease subunit
MIDGWDRQAEVDTKDWSIAEGQFWTPGYDSYDPFTIKESHQVLSHEVQQLIKNKQVTPVLLTEATAFPEGRMQTVLLRGMDLNQDILKLPLEKLKGKKNAILIGSGMAKTLKLKKDDELMVRWRDKNGTFDAITFTVAYIFDCDVPSIDYGSMYMDIEALRKLTGMDNEASILISNDKDLTAINSWVYKDNDFLLADIKEIISAKKTGGYVMTFFLLLIGLLAIFDTQVFSVFRRQKEIGTYIALGMTRQRVVSIFTIEGATNSILAALLGTIYGTPLFIFFTRHGISLSDTADMGAMGITVSDVIYPYYSVGLIASAILLIIISSTIVSYLPSKKIANINPTDAIRGKVS